MYGLARPPMGATALRCCLTLMTKGDLVLCQLCGLEEKYGWQVGKVVEDNLVTIWDLRDDYCIWHPGESSWRINPGYIPLPPNTPPEKIEMLKRILCSR